MARTTTRKKCKSLEMIDGRILHRNEQGEISDVTDQKYFGLKYLAEQGDLAVYILNQCKKRLDLLFMAAERRVQIDASLVRLALNDVQGDLEEGGEVMSYLHQVKDLFENSQALPSPDTRNGSPSLSIIKPA